MSRRWAFISDVAGEFGVQRLYRVLQVSRSGFYRRRAGAEAREVRARTDAEVVEEIRAVHAEHAGAHGAPRIHAELRARGRTINRKRVARLMSTNGIVGRHLRRRKRTTVPDHTAAPVPDLLERDFTAPALDTRWCGDITYIPVGASWLYLATVIGICSRRVVGWSIADHMRADLVVDALESAVAARGGDAAGVIFHSDRGAQYTSGAFATACRRHGIRRSMGRVGSSYDNFFQCRWATKSEARLDIFRWLSYYNHRRRHSSLQYLTPVEFEQRLHDSGSLGLVA